MEGTLLEVIEKYQGKTLSANLPYKTQFMISKEDGKDMKLIVHLVRDSPDNNISCICSVSQLPKCMQGATVANCSLCMV